ncbi:MAG: hypothetical protein ACI4MH_04700 [Candidatus Coproplasma sp.]
MGLFNRKKEKEKDVLLEELGLENNDGKEPEPLKRKDYVKNVRRGKEAEQKKEKLLEAFNKVRIEFSKTPGFDRHLDTLRACYEKLRTEEDNANSAAMARVDGVILQELRFAVDYCHRGGVTAVRSCLSNIDDLVNDRYTCGNQYLNDDYYKMIVARNKFNRSLNELRTNMNKIQRELTQLQQDYNDPTLISERASIIGQRNELVTKYEMYKRQANDMDTKLTNYTKAIQQVRELIVNQEANDDYNLTENINTILGFQAENDEEANANEKLNDLLSQDKRRHTSNSMRINAEIAGITDLDDVGDDFFTVR